MLVYFFTHEVRYNMRETNIIICPSYSDIRPKYQNLALSENVNEFLNPRIDKMKDTAYFLHDVETKRNE